MKKFHLTRLEYILIAGFILLLFFSVFRVAVHQKDLRETWQYEETVESQTLISGITYTQSSKRTFQMRNYEVTNSTMVYQESLYQRVTYDILDSKTGDLLEQEAPLKPMNFQVTYEKINSTVLWVEWDIYLTRMYSEIPSSSFNSESERDFYRSIVDDAWNEIVEPDFFKFNIGYNEISTDTGEMVRTNVELTTNSDPENGRVIKTDLHIIKRNENEQIIYEYNRVIKELPGVQKNLLLVYDLRFNVEYLFFFTLTVIVVLLRIINFFVDYKVSVTINKRSEDSN